MTAHPEELRYHRLDTARDSDGWTPEMVRDLEDDTFDGQIHRLYDDDMPIVLGLLCEDMPTAAEDAAFAGETDEPPECICDSGLLAEHDGECLLCWFDSQERLELPDKFDDSICAVCGSSDIAEDGECVICLWRKVKRIEPLEDDGRPRMYWTPDHVIDTACGAGLIFTDPPFAGDAVCEAMPTAAEDAAFAGETECICGSGLPAAHDGECVVCTFEALP